MAIKLSAISFQRAVIEGMLRPFMEELIADG